jgi:hypothetical protein
MKHLFHFLCLFLACQTLFGQSHNSFDLALSICKKDKILLVPDTASSVFFENSSCGSMGPVPVATYNHFVRFKIKSSGTLVFVIIPTNPNDDLDFQLFQVVPNSPGKITRRCMAAGGISAVDPCMGATGLNYGQTDTTLLLAVVIHLTTFWHPFMCKLVKNLCSVSVILALEGLLV